ncbi:Hypothetical predicted protein [Mytilus galloprovincialis]|uniref:Mab-21-like HhH/H2TH-like domain-containing protein n=1 Tax=Mytilus galloprovincialis TaxID=29158 RepID=A0A8B6DDI7_MYTGA|nr:Hypothetical predicted protein [Mytilus galloprovincialis]
MSAKNSLSMDFYKYLCQKIGYEEEVKVRRLFYIIHDLRAKTADKTQITSGSRGEGLQLKGSDLDLMFIDTTFQVYESDRDVPHSGWCMPLVMNTEDTHPGFTQLHLVNDHGLICWHDNTGEYALENTLHWQNLILNAFQLREFSSELYRLHTMAICSKFSRMLKFHGPCISTLEETHDIASCLKCDKWISEAQPWIIRPRTTWPSPDLISKIISCGVLFVPIGYKGSSNEHLQWRISFSVAEKFLIFSFSQTPLLCYALLKVLVKEIVENHEDLQGLLCSYFLKTLMFWISEESEPSMWRPNTIIPCCMACLKRLIYCVEYSTLLHYFIPDNNLFYLRFNVDQIEKMSSLLKNSFEKGIYCFTRSETLFDIITLHFNDTDSEIRILGALRFDLKNPVCTYRYNTCNLLYSLLHYSSSKISKSIFCTPI